MRRHWFNKHKIFRTITFHVLPGTSFRRDRSGYIGRFGTFHPSPHPWRRNLGCIEELYVYHPVCIFRGIVQHFYQIFLNLELDPNLFTCYIFDPFKEGF